MLPLKHVVTKHKAKPKLKHKSLSSTYSSSISLSSIFTNTLHSSKPKPKPKPKPSFPIPDKQITATTFKTWFQTSYLSNDPLLLRIHQFLSSKNDFSALFTSLNIPLTTPLVLRVLHHVSYNNDIQSCLKFFDWAGRQPRYTHTRATFTAIFRMLTTRAHLMPMLFEILERFEKHELFYHNARFYDTLVVGYAIAGKPEIALHVFGRMRFQGLDLDAFAYHVLLNSLAENEYFNSFDVILNQIRIRGYATRVTDTIVVKRLCEQGRFDEAEEYVNGMLGSGKKLRDFEVSMLVGLLCERKKFERAVKLVKEFGNTGLVPLEHAYGVCIKGLVKGGRLDDALEFFRQTRDTEGSVPHLYRYNMLICRLLRENRLREVYDLLMDMYESSIPPDQITMNVVLCFFCKIGMVNVALQLYESRSQFGLNPNTIAYKYLILNLCWDGSVKEAYSVFKRFIGNDKLFPDRETFTTLANALCRECKVDEMKELMDLAKEREFTLSPVTNAKFISALCQAGRLEDGYDEHGKLENATAKLYYDKMIEGFIKSNKGEIAARLLVEMKEKNLRLTRFSCRAVICRLLDMDNPITRVTKLLDSLTQGKPDTKIFNFFIVGAGHANNTDLAREVYELMPRNNIVPTLLSQRLVLNSYLRNGKIIDALNFFNSLRRLGVVSKKLYCSMVIGLCKSNKVDIAHDFLFEMLNAGVNPDIECFESLVWKLCSLRRYHKAINLVQVYMKGGRRLTSFLGNTLLWHSSLSPDVYGILVHLRGAEEGENSPISTLSFVIGAFSGCLSVNRSIEELEKLIAMCFPLDTHTYNQLLRRVASYDMNQACELFNRMCQRGCKPNGWTYDFMVRGFLNHGRNDEAKQWVEEMHQKGFDLTDSTRINVRKMILSNEE
ncbi:putative pentatricopeptide [Medicago truncatula]|uniref:Putative pentatricopeptide n=1 Tax=Medicago truncatula TaxID=3880 RepID=A0A396I1C7_MEDTR|nr:pentatricopeptide repeat-containing protein At1g71210, mitochondrial [Medicago truncatula]RHN57505.1 putative pentatricopeptide [Medicago truncatula]